MEDFGNKILQQLSVYYSELIDLLPRLVMAMLVFTIVFIIAVKVTSLVDRKLRERTSDPLLANFLTRMFRWALIVLGFLLFLNIIGLRGIAGSILAGAGVSAFILGFAFKDIGENLLAGVMLAFSRPFRVGDMVQVNDVTGRIVQLKLRTTHMKTPDGRDVYVPNAVIIKNVLSNHTIDGFMRYDFIIGVDQGADVNHVRDLMLEALNSVDGVLKGAKAPMVHIDKLSASTLDMKAFFWINVLDPNTSALEVKTAAIDRCLQRLAAANVNLPASVIELKNYADGNLSVRSSAG